MSHTFVSFTEKLMVHHERIVSNREKKKILAILFYPFPFFSFFLFFECTRLIVPIKNSILEIWHWFGGGESAGLPVSKAREKCTLRPAALAFIDARANARKRALSLSLFPSPLSSCSPSWTRSVPPSLMLSRVSTGVRARSVCSRARAIRGDRR